MGFSNQTSAGVEPSPDAGPTDSHRRHALDILGKSDAPMALADLAADIGTRESEDSGKDIDWERIQRIYVALYHNHIPRLAEWGIVEFNTARRTVTRSKSAASAERPTRGV